jgi:DNA-binding CsgD family transcriptional regulator
MRVASGRGGELERAFAFGTVRQVFEPVVGEAGPAKRALLLAGAAAPAASIVAPDGAGRVESELGGLHGIYWLTTNLSREQPLMIAVDDLHWVDDPSLRALSYLARRLADIPVALVVTLRPGEPGAPHELLDAICAQADAVTTRLRPLGSEAIATMVSSALPGADDELCDACFEASAGNPFYLHELLISLDGHASAEHARVAAAPELGDRIVRRIDRIGPEAAALAQAMAVMGDGGSLDAAAAASGVEPSAAAAVASRLSRVEILAREDPFEFAHPLVRRSIYDALSVAERDRAHAAAAHVLGDAGASAGMVGAHLSRLRPAGSPEVVAGLRAAAREAASRGAPEAAAAVLRRGLEEGAADPPRAELLYELGQMEVVARDLTAVGHLNEALELADDVVLRARIALPLGAILGAMGQWDTLLPMLSDAIDGLDGREPELDLELQSFRAIALANDGDLVGEFVRDEGRLLELAQGEPWAARALCALLAVNWVGRGERIDEARRLIDHGMRDGRLLRERGSTAWPAPQVLSALILIEDTPRALEVADQLAAIARRDGSTLGSLTAVAFRAWSHVRSGDLAAAEGEMQTVMDVALPNDLQMELATFYWFLGDALGERPGIDAFAAAVEGMEPQAEFGRTMAGAMMREVRGRYMLHVRGDRAGAVGELRAAVDVYRRLRVSPVRGPSRSALALALPADARDEAVELAEEEVALAEQAGLPRPLAIALRAQARLNGRDEEVELLRRSVALLESTDARLEQARSLVALGSALRRRSHRVDAREPLTAGLELAERAGAGATSARAAEELKAAGAPPRRRARTGTYSLTVSEARVARLVATGRSNAEVAQELFVSLKTIETHLTRIYSKLSLSGPNARQRLAAALADS